MCSPTAMTRSARQSRATPWRHRSRSRRAPKGPAATRSAEMGRRRFRTVTLWRLGRRLDESVGWLERGRALASAAIWLDRLP
eukprot:3185217-Prymnesium_polylepis.1